MATATQVPVSRKKQDFINVAIARRRDDGLPELSEAELAEVGEQYDKIEIAQKQARADKTARQKAAQENPIVLANSNNAPPTANPKTQGTILPNPDLPVVGGGLNLPPGAQAVTELVPATVAIGAPSFDIHVKGAGFTDESVIVFNGFDEPTTFVSATELTTGINMPLWLAPAVVPVAVKNADETISNSIDFSFTGAAAMSASKTPPVVPPRR